MPRFLFVFNSILSFPFFLLSVRLTSAISSHPFSTTFVHSPCPHPSNYRFKPIGLFLRYVRPSAERALPLYQGNCWRHRAKRSLHSLNAVLPAEHVHTYGVLVFHGQELGDSPECNGVYVDTIACGAYVTYPPTCRPNMTRTMATSPNLLLKEIILMCHRFETRGGITDMLCRLYSLGYSMITFFIIKECNFSVP
jgi:hypothetical protein